MSFKFGVFFVSLCLVLLVAFGIFSFQNYSSIQGLAVLGEEVPGHLANETSVVLEVDALNALNNSVAIIDEMNQNNFSVFYMNDALSEAKRVFTSVRYAEMLRGNIVANPFELAEAHQALSVVDWRKLSYSDVLVYTNEIETRRIRAFDIFDSINAFEIEIANSASEGINVSDALKILSLAKDSFYSDRYDEAENYLFELQNNLESARAQLSTISTFRKSATNFFVRNKFSLSVAFLVFLTIFLIAYRKMRIGFLKRKIEKMKAEMRGLNELLRVTQRERFKDNKISELVYNIRLKKYKERMRVLKQELPVVENRLRLSLKFFSAISGNKKKTKKGARKSGRK